jgi:imidazole glycerol-phosphate synthase subunit HisH
MARIAVLDYGSGNLHSVSRALTRAGAEVSVTSAPGEVERADAAVIPGVGHFGQCVRAIRAAGLDSAIKQLVAGGRPVFGVCVGMQVLFDASEEEGDTPGLGLVPGTVRRLPSSVPVPHMGWNSVEWTGDHPFREGLGERPWWYFVHSFAPPADGPETIATTEHGTGFASVIAKDNLFATQFHPEKSGGTGLRLYRNFVEAVGAA